MKNKDLGTVGVFFSFFLIKIFFKMHLFKK